MQAMLIVCHNAEMLTCPSLAPLPNGVITFTPGTDNTNVIGPGSMATYSCNLGYVLVGQTTRLCISLHEGAASDWTGYAPICRGYYTSNNYYYC